MLFALLVGGYHIWAIGRGLPWGNHGCLPVGCHIMAYTTDWVIYLVCRKFSRTSEKLCMGPGPPKLTHAPWIGVCEQGIYANMVAGCMCGLNNPLPALGADNVIRTRTSLTLPQAVSYTHLTLPTKA